MLKLFYSYIITVDQSHQGVLGYTLMDPLRQSIVAAGVPSFEEPSTSVRSPVNNVIGLDDDLGLSKPLTPPVEDRSTPPLYEDISPSAEPGPSSSYQRPSSVLQTPQHQTTPRQTGSYRQTHRCHSTSVLERQNQEPSSPKERLTSTLKRTYHQMALEAEATLPLLEDFNEPTVDHENTRNRVCTLVSFIKTSLDELSEIGVVKSDFEDQYQRLHEALIAQRQCVRRLKDRCYEIYNGNDETFNQCILDLSSRSDSSSLKDLEITRLNHQVKEYELMVAQLEASVQTRNAEIALLKEQLNQFSGFKTPKGKTPLHSKHPYPKRSLPSFQKDTMASIETPRHNPF